MNYVTVDTVTEKLGPLWWGNGDAAQAVIRANAWLVLGLCVLLNKI